MLINKQKDKVMNLKCDECEGMFMLGATGLKFGVKKAEDDVDVFITYFICPHCSKVYIFNIETNELIEQRTSIRKLNERIDTNVKKGRKVKPSLLKTLSVKEKLYKKLRQEVIEKYKGVAMMVEQEEQVQ